MRAVRVDVPGGGRMRAVRVEAFGGPERLSVIDAAPSPCTGGQVRMRVHAAAVGRTDLLKRAGLYPGGPTPPFLAGVAAAGVIEETGERVMALLPEGAQATEASVERRACIPIPDDLDFVRAAALPIPFFTAYHALVTVGRAARGETVLVHGAAGSVGAMAVQIARNLDLHVVATASTSTRRQFVFRLGAHEAIGYPQARRLRPDLVVDPVGGRVLQDSLRILPPLGRVVAIGCASVAPVPIDAVGLIHRSAAVLGFHLEAVLGREDLMAAALERLWAWIAEGALHLDVAHVFGLEEIRSAHALIEARQNEGSVVIVP